jgi:hypothetical protein
VTGPGWAKRELDRMALEVERPIRDLMGATLPAENQQTVEALAEKIGSTLNKAAFGTARTLDYNEASAALRDLVAQAELAAELGEALQDIADMDAGLHKPECRVPPAGDGGGA